MYPLIVTRRPAGLPSESDRSARPRPRVSLGPAAPLLLRVSTSGAPDPTGELPARLPFRRYHADLRGFSVLAAHHAERARIQQAISREYDLDDEPISSGTAWRLAYQERTDAPSAYDLIILCNFLTNATMTEGLRAELTGLARSLTSGGVLLVLGAVGGAYQAIYATVNELATTAGLRPLPDVSRQLEANPDPALRDLIATQLRSAVSDLGSNASPEVWATVDRTLRQHVPDVVDHDLPFTMPRFQVLGFRCVTTPWPRRWRRDRYEITTVRGDVPLTVAPPVCVRQRSRPPDLT